MKAIIAALLCSVALPAWAGDAFSTGDSHGPRAPSGKTDQPYGRIIPARTPVTPSWVDTPWGYYGGGTLGYVERSPGDMKRIIAENNEHARRTYDGVVDAGGCNAEYVPFEIASYCGSQAFGGGQNGQFGSAGD